MADMSFLPEDYLEKRAHRRTNLICMALFVVVMGTVVGAYLVSDRQRTEIREQRLHVNTRFEEAAKRLEQLDKLQQRKAEMLRKAQITSTLLERVPRTLILSQLINAMPATMSLLELSLDTKVVKTAPTAKTAIDKVKAEKDAKSKKAAAEAPGFAGAPEPKNVDVNIGIVGLAKTDSEVSDFMRAVQSLPLFSGVNLGYSEQIKVEDRQMRRFRVDVQLNQGVNLRQFEPVMVKRELKQNPMANVVNIDERGELAPLPREFNNPNIVDKPRRTLKD